jgi:hypothetical protein
MLATRDSLCLCPAGKKASRGRRCFVRSLPRNTLATSAFLPRALQTEDIMGRGILLWLIGVPIPIIILLALFVR